MLLITATTRSIDQYGKGRLYYVQDHYRLEYEYENKDEERDYSSVVDYPGPNASHLNILSLNSRMFYNTHTATTVEHRKRVDSATMSDILCTVCTGSAANEEGSAH